MTDKFTLRWDIDNPEVTLANGRAESEVFDEGGFKWTVAVEEDRSPPVGWEKFTLRCDADNAREWKCEADVEMYYLSPFGDFYGHGQSERHGFNATDHTLTFGGLFCWYWMKGGFYSVNNKMSLEFRVTIISSERRESIVDPGLFSAPNRRSDVILKIGDNKLHVSKEYLAVKSSVFETLFLGEFAENGKDEVELNDVDYEEFLDFLHVIYFEDVKITDCMVLHILKLADRFLVERVLKLSIEHLKQSNGFDNLKKLLVADQYNITSLKDHCIRTLMSEADPMGKLKAFPEIDNFSDGLMLALFKLLLKK